MIRKLSLCGLACVLLVCSQTPMLAQTKDELARQVQQLKKSLAERDKHVASLQTQLQKAKQELATLKKKNPGAAKLQKDLDAANQALRDKDAQIAALQGKSSSADLSKELIRLRRDLQAVKKASFAHVLIVKLKTLDDAPVKTITDEAGRTLAKIDGVRSLYVGRPAEYNTPEPARRDYQLGIVVLLDDADALEKFLDDPLHKQFTDRMGSLWDRPMVYDIQRDKDEPRKADSKKGAK